MPSSWSEPFRQPVRFSWEATRDFLLITAGVFLQALALRLFLVPAQLVSGGVTGLAQIVNYYTGWPIGVMVLLGNVPLFLLGWRYLGGPRFAMRTAYAVVAYSFLADALTLVLPQNGITDDILLNAMYGGVISGFGYGLVYRGRGTSGGSDILARILIHWRNIPISQSYIWVDSLIILGAGLTFSWTKALYALVVLYISGIAAEASTQGTNIVRTAMIITQRPQALAQRIMEEMERGVTILDAKGGFTGEQRTLIYCVVSRSEVAQIKALVKESDPGAFMVIGQAYEALGEGFHPLDSSPV
jgi:uncharacterized membrane-anchored protein YitT (DUF2179 family)